MSAELVRDEDYLSEEDSDFAPEEAPAEESSVSDDDEAADAEKSTQGKRKRQDVEDGAEDAGFENSGDEAIIEKGKRRQKKAKRKDGEADEDEGGEGGLIKTRRMRAAEKAEKRAEVASGPVTIDVDALWAQMTSEPVGKKIQAEPATTQPTVDGIKPPSQPQQSTENNKADELDLIRIKRTYNFAGKVHTEEKLVPRDSAEAKLYLAEKGADAAASDNSSSPTQKRMPRKAFRSAFEPVASDGPAHRSDLNLAMSERLRARELAKADAKKLNTVEKSRMDWAGFVDREGIKDELELAGKSKHSFATRQDFLARSEAVREQEARRLRMAGKA
ncbi:BCNT-domain-containing protein [Parathielavia appendiculata]|uniref:SWR1-complex protein 5 n=1 Tax=Parathielavia appendiculata TaxID=2587402 RepID=A0AAN6Z3G3_9PEZI|nr:BCNT-domain-containing protein [Parathielavia appendiculata]